MPPALLFGNHKGARGPAALYLGATLGGAFAVAMQHLAPGFPLDVATMAVLGMAAVVAGSTGAALTAIVIIFEMTRDYHVVIPMIIIVSISYGVRQFLMADTIYTFKLTRRNHPVPASLETNLFMLRKASDFYDSRVIRVGSTRGMAEVRRRFRRFGRQSPNVLVLNREQRFRRSSPRAAIIDSRAAAVSASAAGPTSIWKPSTSSSAPRT